MGYEFSLFFYHKSGLLKDIAENRKIDVIIVVDITHFLIVPVAEAASCSPEFCPPIPL